MTNREIINVLLHHKEAFEISGKTADAIDMAISVLKKQEVDKCCETCKHKHLDVDASPCCDCIRAKDHYIPRTEEEA